jgi:hypothetical protein
MKSSLHSLIPFLPFLLNHSTAISRDSLNSVSSQSQSQSHITTDGQSTSKSWCRAPSGAPDQIFITYSLTVTVLFLWGAISDERMGLSFLYAAGPHQRSLPRVRFPWDSRPYFTLSDLRLLFSSPPTTRRVTVEVFEPASTRVLSPLASNHRYMA